jgi:hypothetical protein
MKILTGEIEETNPDDGKDPAAKALGKLGGKARAQGMSAKRRTEIARHRSAFAATAFNGLVDLVLAPPISGAR